MWEGLIIINAMYLSAPLQFVINITNKCNLRCLHCFNNSGNDDDITEKELYKLIMNISQLKPYNVCFSGGEPLLKKTELINCTRILKQNNVRVSLASNGMLLNKEVIYELAISGVREISISLDGPNKYVHNYLRGDNFAFTETFKNLMLLNNLKIIDFEPTITINKVNIINFEEFVILMIKNNFKKIGIRIILPLGRALNNKDVLMLNYEDIRYISKIVNKYKNDIQIIFNDSINHLLYYRKGEPFYGMEIKSNGDIIASPYLQIKLGNIKNHTIKEYWDNGWTDIWNTPLFKKILKHLYSIEDLEIINTIIKKYNKETNDLIDNNSFLYI